jgi:hypothetical protein
MEQTRIKLSALWVCLMLTYLLGDVLRIFSGDFSAGEVIGMEISPGLMLAMAVLMVIPIVMVLLTLILKQAVSRWANIVLSVFYFAFNAIGLPTYPSLYDQFLIVVGLVLNVVIVWMAWRWKEQEL